MIKYFTKILPFLTLTQTSLYTFSSQVPTKRVGKYVVPQLPKYSVNRQAIRPFTKDDEQLTIGQYNRLVGGYRQYRDLPQCRYFAIQYHNRIHHIFNAYHYVHILQPSPWDA